MMEPVQVNENYIPKPSESELGVGHPQQNTVASNALDVEEARKEIEEPPKPSLKEILTHPCDYMSILIFLGAAMIGLIFFIIAAVGQGKGLIVSIFLLLIGAYASYEIRMLAALKKELNALKEVQKQLAEQVDKLESQVDIYDKQNEEFKQETAELADANERFKQEVEELERISHDLTRSKEEFEAHNEDLKDEMGRLDNSNNKMKENLETLTKQTDELERQYKQFEALQGQIQKYAEQNGVEMSAALEKQNEMFARLENVMKDNASTLLQQIAMDMEFLDGGDGMTREEYDSWYERIPQRFKDMLIAQNITFDTFCGEDEIMDYDEMASLIESLLGQNSDA